METLNVLLKKCAVCFSGIVELDQIIGVLLKTEMAIGCIVAIILDNALPGTAEERGINKWRQMLDVKRDEIKSPVSIHIYDPISPRLWVDKNWLKYVPFLPYYPLDESVYMNDGAININLPNSAPQNVK